MLQGVERRLCRERREESEVQEDARRYMAFRGDQYQWWRVAEFNYDLFMIRQKL